METAKLLFEILRSEVNEGLIEAELCRDYDSKALFRLAKAHDLMYCVTDALYKVGLLPQDKPVYDAYVKEQMTAVVRTARIEGTLKRIKEILNETKIPFAPLKGARLRYMYPDKMMRTSCDIDILVKEEHLDQAVSALVEQGFTTDGKRDYHDISLYYGYYGSVHLELHFNICEDMEDIDALLKRVWEYVEPVSEYEYQEKPEFFAYHHIAHMKYHFVNGGCGIRPFLDLYVMKKVGFYEETKLMELLEMVGLTSFYHAILQVTTVWFKGDTSTELTKRCEEYILRGGVYGSAENSIAAQSAARNGRFKNMWHIMFPGNETMCNYYPGLKHKIILLPFYYMKRIFFKAFGKSGKRVRTKMKKIASQDQANINSVGELLAAMGLKNSEAI